MRERWAIALAILTGLVVVLASAAFAAMQNPPRPPAASIGESGSADAPDATSVQLPGRAVYEANSCARCHQLAGEGSPRSPLDGVGARLSRDELRQWITADDAIADDLSKRAWEAKQAYRSLPAADLEALIDYLASQQ